MRKQCWRARNNMARIVFCAAFISGAMSSRARNMVLPWGRRCCGTPFFMPNSFKHKLNSRGRVLHADRRKVRNTRLVLAAGFVMMAATAAQAAKTPEIALPDVLAVELPKGTSQIG